MSIPSRPRTACRATPSSGSRSKARSTTTRSAGRAMSGCSAGCGWCRRSRRGRAYRWRSSRARRPGRVRRREAATAVGAAGRRDSGASPCARRSMKSNPRRRGQDAERLLRSFLKKAYRRPVAEADVQRFLRLFDDQFQQGSGFTRSMLSAYTAVLSSPGFVFVEEKPGRLDGYALATRLALFLWNSIPDDTLRALADRGELSRPDVLRAQAERMLDDPKARRFVEAFTDYWLDLRKIDDTSPSTTIYNDYELDDPLKLAAVEETRLFFAELLRTDLPARNIIDSDFTFLNERLADHYGIAGVSGVRIPQGEAAGRQPPRRGDDAGQRPEGDGQRHDDLAGAARPLDHRADPGAGDAAPAADGQGRRAGYPRRGDDPPAVGEAPRRRELRLLPQQDGPAGLRAGELRRDGRLPRALPGGLRKSPPGPGLRPEWAGVRVPLRPAGRFGRRVARRPAVQGRARAQEAAGQGGTADRAEPGPAVDDLRHRRAGAVFRSGGDRENPRRGEGQPVRRAAASSTRSCRATSSGTSRKDRR